MPVSLTIRIIIKRLWVVCLLLGFLSQPVHAQKRKKQKKKETRVKQQVPAGEKPAKKSTRIFYGQASFYSNKFNGRRTASGELFSQEKYTCACNVLPMGTWVKVTNLKNGKWAYVKVNDRIHPKMNRVVDLSKIAATKLGYVSRGLTRVKVEVMGKKKPK
jgi:rare lipoprotein A